MFGIGARFGTLAIAAAILFISMRLQKSSKRGAKNLSIIGAFLAGLAFLVTFVGGWMRGADWLGGFCRSSRPTARCSSRRWPSPSPG